MLRPKNVNLVQIQKRKTLSRDELSQALEQLDKQVWANLQSETIPIRSLSGRLSKSYITPPGTPTPDCLTCGVCCAAVLHVQAGSGDAAPSENIWDITIAAHKDDVVIDRVLKRDVETGRCAALGGDLGREIKCEIYPIRPSLCRKFDAGSDKCHALRRAYGLEAPLTHFEVIEALERKFECDEPEESMRLIVSCEINSDYESRYLQIVVWTETEESRVTHKFMPAKEKWLEGDFVGLTLGEAEKLVTPQ
jgi:uncharacterized protein